MPYAVTFDSYVWGFESFTVMNLCLLSSLYSSHKCKKKIEYGERTKENEEVKTGKLQMYERVYAGVGHTYKNSKMSFSSNISANT